MQTLEIYQSLWAMELRQPGLTEGTLAENIARISEAGFAGPCLDLGMDDVPMVKAARPLLDQHGLKCLFNGFPKSDDELRYMLDMSRDYGAPYLSVIGQVMPLEVAQMVEIARRWMEIADGAGQTLLFETHRHGLLNDLYPTLLLLEAVPDIKLCADLSHFVVDREFALPLGGDQQAMMTRILDQSWSLQGRVANNEQVQVQIGFPQHQKWLAQFTDWWEEGILSWRRRAAPDAALAFLCELGPPPYAITGADGRELSNRWEEALQIREIVTSLWTASLPEQDCEPA